MPYFTLSRLNLVLAMLFGGAGVGLQAAGTHLGATNLTTAGQFLLFHAPAVLGLVALRRLEYLRPRPASFCTTVLVAGVLLFSADLAIRGFLNRSLFPMAAPIGGVLMIGGWLLLAGIALLPRRVSNGFPPGSASAMSRER